MEVSLRSAAAVAAFCLLSVPIGCRQNASGASSIQYAYPSTMITTGDHDDRVVPAHNTKSPAELEHHQRHPSKILSRGDKGSSHVAGKPVGRQIDEPTDCLAFTFHEMGVEYGALLTANPE